MTDLAMHRRFFAEEIQVASNLRNPAVVDALATVPRERFLREGPWTIRGEADFQAPPRQTADGDPRHVYHNIAVAIDPARMLFNGVPGLLAMAIDHLGLRPGGRVLHVGVGTGYYTAIAAHCVGPSGRVLGIEVDESLAAEARANLASMAWAEVRHGDGSGDLGESFDAILVNAGMTHPLESWLDALADGGRMILPLTATMPGMGPIGKGPMVLLTRTAAADVLDARLVGFVAIYSALGLRDEPLNQRLGQALAKMPMPPLKHLRRDRHDATDTCWLHGPTSCLSTA
ncbi:MAG: protein-L-isoaspartate O-methyltransferase [Vicinamibacterales bacterium]